MPLSGHSPQCCICLQPLTGIHTNTQHALGCCSRPKCRQLFHLKNTLPASIYNRRIKFERERLLKDIEQQAESAIKQNAAEQLEAEQAAQLKDRYQLDDSIPIVNLPTAPSITEEITPQRIDRYKSHLQQVIEKSHGKVLHDNALQNEADLERQKILFKKFPRLETLSHTLCGLCRGSCCTEGEDDAFISPHTIRRIRKIIKDNDQSLTDDDILTLYLNHVPEEALTGGCINQTAAGCSLPKHLRSETCNQFYCPSLDALHKNPEHTVAAPSIYAIQREYGLWERIKNAVTGQELKIHILSESAVTEIE